MTNPDSTASKALAEQQTKQQELSVKRTTLIVNAITLCAVWVMLTTAFLCVLFTQPDPNTWAWAGIGSGIIGILATVLVLDPKLVRDIIG